MREDIPESEMSQEQNCVFCKIIGGEVPSHKVFEDDKIIVILDIYPSTNGHVLVIPKEHAPIMPLVSGDILKHIFRKVKYLCRGVREGVPSAKTTIFIANGGIAGQQSPHFLFHIIPRDDGDKLDNFLIPEKDVNQDELIGPLRANLGRIMGVRPQGVASSATAGPSIEQKKRLSQLLEEHKWLKQKIINNPEEVSKELEKNPEVKKLFQGIDIMTLSQKLRQLEEHNSEVEEQEKKEQTTTNPNPITAKKAKEPEEEPEKSETPAEDNIDDNEDDDQEQKNQEKNKDKDDGLLDKVTNMFTQ